ncbi:MAG TPA: T9SS type A sorting domain-containing protein, partial [Membranihabitans sp.]|nr:T9SS type A sorting domain-containing protein [Membranihabitans sp.]
DPHTRRPNRIKYWVRSYLNRFNRPVEHNDPDIYAYPNPAIGYVNIEMNNLKPGNYRVALFNFLAQEVYQIPVEVSSDETIRIDITEFEKGPYLYALIDQYGRRIITKRLTILKP